MKRIPVIAAALTILTTVALTTWAQRQPGPRGRFHPLLRVFDDDQDGLLSAEEIATASAKLKALDTSGDDKLDDEELRTALPFGRPPGAPGGSRSGRAGGAATGEFQPESLARNDFEKRVLNTLKEMWQGERFANVSATDGRLLRLLAETIGAQNVVEIGTSTGESAVWLAMALRATGGRLYTHEIDARRAGIARRNFAKAGVDDIVTLIEGDAHETVKQHKDPIDILFLDADKEGYIDYLNKLRPLIRPGGLIIAHNMNTRQADPRFIAAVTEDRDLETLTLLKEGTGVGVTLKKR